MFYSQINCRNFILFLFYWQQVRQALDDEIAAISTNLNDNLKIRERKQSLYSLQHVYKSLKKLSSILSMETFMENPSKIDILEQAAIELNQLKFHMSRCKSDISVDQEKVCIFCRKKIAVKSQINQSL